MRTAARVATGCLVAAIVVAGGTITAQKGPKVLAAVGGFRCDGHLAGTCDGTDRVRDDGDGAYAFLVKASSEGSQLNTNGEYYLWLQTGGEPRSLVVDLADKISGGDCEQTPSGCYYQQAWGNLPTINIDDGWLRTNVLEADGATELKGGLLALPCGTARESRMLITFTNPQKSVTMTLRYYDDAFPPSNMVQITRHTRTTWTIETAPDAATAVLVGSALVRGKLSGTRQEGVFNMPFRLSVTVPEAPVKTDCAG